jgi:hypothetical protein
VRHGSAEHAAQKTERVRTDAMVVETRTHRQQTLLPKKESNVGRVVAKVTIGRQRQKKTVMHTTMTKRLSAERNFDRRKKMPYGRRKNE